MKTASTIPVHCSFDAIIDATELIPHPENPNTHDDKQIALLAKIIDANGWRANITISKRSGFIIAGHGRLMAAQLLGVEQVPVEYQEFETEAAELQHLLADNQIATYSELNRDLIKSTLEKLDDGSNDMDLTGFDQKSLAKLFEAAPPEKEPGASECPNCGYVKG